MEVSAIFVVLILPGAFAGPVLLQRTSDACATKCPESSKFSYRAGNTYEYRYEGETRTTMAGAAEDTATIRVQATAFLEVLDQCEMALRLSDVSIKRSHEQTPQRMVTADNLSLARRALEARTLRFAFYDGVVGELCPEDAEDLWALNMKRGVLASFQNSMRQLDHEEHIREADVTGECPTHYKVTQKGWKSLTVSKVKDVLACSNRHGSRSSLLSTPYLSLNSLQSVPLMKSSHTCDQDISSERKLLQSSSCQEIHVVRPFSKASNGAVTEVSQKLVFVKDAVGVQTRKDTVQRRATLLFEHEYGLSLSESSVDTVKSKLGQLCTVSVVDIRPEVPRLFGELVHLMRDLDYSDLREVDRNLKLNLICQDNSVKTRKFFLDALPMMGTGAAIRLMGDLLASEEITDSQVTIWVTSLAFLPNPSKDAIAAAQSLVTNEKTRQKSLLPVSALVNNYCESNADCEGEAEVAQILGKLTDVIGFDCRVNNGNLKDILLTLRAIGNIGRSDSVTLNLQPCFTKSDLPMDVRVAAIDAFRRLPCSADRNNVMEVFLRQSEDAELRIAAYLAVLKCPTDNIVQQVRQALLSEKVNQVGSFVWTHLTNLLETDSPHKQSIRDLLENELLQREYSMDRRKYSRNYEVSFFSEKFNVGGVYENNLIWSPNSFVPRSLMLNLTVDLFGYSVNLLELGGRVQGLEYLLDAYNGPSSRDTGSQAGYGVSKTVKDEKLARVKSKYGNIKDELRAQLYLRVFGNELAYTMIDGSDVKRTTQSRSFFDQLLAKLSQNEEFSFTQSTMFLDSTLVIPTVLGIPLNLTLNGSASVDLKASRKVDFTKMNSKSKSFEIAASLQPSSAVEISSTMSVDAFVTSVGLKMTSRLHTSTAIQGNMQMTRGQIFSLDIDTPRDTQELIDFQSKFYLVHDDHEKEQKLITANRKEKKACTGEPLAKIIGFDLCAELSFPNATLAQNAPYFPFTGPTSLSVTLRKQDLPSGYKVIAKQMHSDTASIAQIAVDTPGSVADRAISIGYDLNFKDQTFDAEAHTPWKKVNLKGAFENGKKQYKTTGTLSIQPDLEYSVTAQVNKDIYDQKEAVFKLTPSILINSSSGEILSLIGDAYYKESKTLRAKLNMNMKEVLQKPIAAEFVLTTKDKAGQMQYKNNFKLSSEFLSLKGSSNLMTDVSSSQRKSTLMSLRSRFDYNLHSWPSVKRNQIKLGVKVHDRSTATLKKYSVNANMDAKYTPEANVIVSGEMSHKSTLTEMEVKIRHGKNIKLVADKSKEMVIAANVNHKIKESEALVSFDVHAVYPDQDMDYEVKGKHEHNKEMVEQYLNVRYGKGKTIDAHTRLTQTKTQRTATLDLAFPGRDMKFNAELNKKAENHHILSAFAQLEKGEKNSLVASFKRPTPDSVEITSELGISNRSPAKLDISGNYALRKMSGKGQLVWDNKTYSLQYTSDIQRERYGAWTLGVVCPERKITGRLEGGLDRAKGTKKAEFEVLWDADKDPSQKVGVGVEIADRLLSNDVHVGATLEVFTPVTNYQHFKAQLECENSARRIATVAEIVPGRDSELYSVKFDFKLPVAKENFGLVSWIKTPYAPLKVMSLQASHSFDASGQLSDSLRGDFNNHFLEIQLSGNNKGTVITRVYDGSASFKSTIPGAERFVLTFNHNDNNRKYVTQTSLDMNGHLYWANLEANFNRVHVQVTTDGTLVVRIPQRANPLQFVWKHRNSLHELNTTVTVEIEPTKRVQLEVGARADIVSNRYAADVALRGPWNKNMAEHVTQLQIRHQHSKSAMDTSVNLKLDREVYSTRNTYQRSSGTVSWILEYSMSQPPFKLKNNMNVKYEKYPMTVSMDLQMDETSLLNINGQLESLRNGTYNSNLNLVVYLKNSTKTITLRGNHTKERSDWMTKGSVIYEGQMVSVEADMDLDTFKSMKLTVSTPFSDVRKIGLDYEHSGTDIRNFKGKYSILMQPLFDKVSTEISWLYGSIFRSRLRVDTPFRDMRYLEVNGQSLIDSGKRKSYLELELNPRQLYKLDTTYMFNFPQEVDFALTLTTPLPEVPSIQTELGFKYTDDEVTGKLKIAGQAFAFQEFGSTIGHRRGANFIATEVDATLSPGQKLSGRANLKWENEIEGTITVSNAVQGQHPMQLVLSHRGHTWEDFQTKAGFRMNGDRLEAEVALSNKNGRSGLFMLATPDPDLSYVKATFLHRMTDSSYEGRWTAQYGETSKPFDLGVLTTYTSEKIAFSTDFKCPYTEDFEMELGFEVSRNVETKVLASYGANNKVDMLLKYKLRETLWDVGAEFEYLIQGSGKEIGLTFKRDGPLDNLMSQATCRFMGKRITIDAEYKDRSRKSGNIKVRSNFKDFTDLSASFEHEGDSEKFQTRASVKYMDGKEAQGTVDFTRSKWKQVTMTSTFKLPIPEYSNNSLTYQHTYRKDRLSADATLWLGSQSAIKGNVELTDNSRLNVSITGPFKDFNSFSASGVFDEKAISFDGDATLALASQEEPIVLSYSVKAATWPVMVTLKAQTGIEDWESIDLAITHDGEQNHFATTATLEADAVGIVMSEATWKYASLSSFDGLWTLSSNIEGAKDLKVAVRNSQVRGDDLPEVETEYLSHVEIGWDLLKHMELDGSLKINQTLNKYSGSFSMSSPFPDAAQIGFSFNHAHDERKIKDTLAASYNGRTYLDTDFQYSVDDRRVGSLEFREPRSMSFVVGGKYTKQSAEGELKLNWDKSSPEMNLHITGERQDRSDKLGIDKAFKLWVMHPARTMGLEHVLRKAEKEFQNDFLLTWDKAMGSTMSYDVKWTDRSSRFSSAYDAMVKVGVPMRSVQVEGTYSDNGRVQATKGSVMWDADRDLNLKVGMSGELDSRGKSNKVKLGLDLPFIDKQYYLTSESTLNSGSTILDGRTEFSYSSDPRKLLVLTSRIEDNSFGRDTRNYSVSFGVLHPMTDVNIQVTSHIGNSKTMGSVGSRLVYLTTSREKKAFELNGQVDRSRKSMLLELKSPVKDVSLEGNLQQEENFKLQLSSKEDGQITHVTDVLLTPRTRTMELQYKYDKENPANTLNFIGHMISDSLLQAEMYRMNQGQRVSEALVTVRLNSSHVLHTRLNWRPSVFQDLQEFLSTQLTVFSYSSSEAFKVSAEAVGREVEGKYLAIMQEVREEAGPLVEQLQKEMNMIQTQLNNVQRDFRRFYQSNTLYARDLSNVFVGGFDNILPSLKVIVDRYREFYASAQQKIAEAMQMLGKYPMAQRYAQLVQEFAMGLKNMRTVLEQTLDQLSLQVGWLSDSTYQKYMVISRQIERKLQGYTAALQESTPYQGLAHAYNQMRSGLGHVTQGDYRKLAEVTNEKMIQALDRLGLKEYYVRIVVQGKQLLLDQFHDIVQRPEFQQIYVVTNEIYQQSLWAYHYLEVEKNMQLAVAQLLELAKDVALLEISRVKNAIVDLDKSRVIVYDPQNGEMQFEIYLPVALKSLAEPPDVRLTKYVNRVKSWIATYVPSQQQSLWTTINKYMPNMDSSTWLPPYTAYAYVMGDQHMVTFDRTYYNFAGRCSYVLARDMADDRFTVILNYNNRPRQPQIESLVVLLRGVAIEIGKDNKVKVNDQETELPFFSDQISAVRQQNAVRIQDGSDLTVEMDVARGIYSVGISGWYHGRTAGLLGSYDNEAFNDLIDSSRTITNDVEEFANSWEVSSRQCRSRNMAEMGELDQALPEVQACQKHLSGSSSYYSPCFGQVSAAELIRTCVEYVRSGLTQQAALCKVGQQYRYMCQRRGIFLSTPAECITCDFTGAGNTTTFGTTEEIRPPQTIQSSADVVFVVEESDCNGWANRLLPRVATELGQALTKQGLTANRFGLVSFTGNATGGGHFVHTIEGNVFGNPSNFLKATESLRLTYKSMPGNPSNALREAMKYPFRLGVAKILVLVPCSSCNGETIHLGRVMVSHGFVLHVLNQQNFRAPDSDNHGPLNVYGMDRTKLLTGKSERRNTDVLLQHLESPTDSCITLALLTNGSVFDVAHVSERERIQRDFIEAFAARGAQNAAPPTCQVCNCYDDGTGRGHTVCRSCDEHSWLWNDIPKWLQSSSTSMMGMFNDFQHRVYTSLSNLPLAA